MPQVVNAHARQPDLISGTLPGAFCFSVTSVGILRAFPSHIRLAASSAGNEPLMLCGLAEGKQSIVLVQSLIMKIILIRHDHFAIFYSQLVSLHFFLSTTKGV
jgi:hypothetical protein